MAFYRSIPIFPQQPQAMPRNEMKQPIIQRIGKAGPSVSNSDIPANILGFRGPGTLNTNTQPMKEAESSNFLITVNSNVSYKLTPSEDQKASLIVQNYAKGNE